MWLIELAVEEGGEVLDLLLGGERGVEHGRVGDPLLGTGGRVRLPTSSPQESLNFPSKQPGLSNLSHSHSYSLFICRFCPNIYNS